MTNEVDSSVVLAELQVALFRKCVIICDLVNEVGHSPVLQIRLQISIKTSIIVSPPQLEQLYSSEQYSIHLLRISFSSVKLGTHNKMCLMKLISEILYHNTLLYTH